METKGRVKKAVEAEKKLFEKQNKACKQARAKSRNKSSGTRKLALNNSQAIEPSTFKDILSDPLMRDDPQSDDNTSAATNPTQVLESLIGEILATARLNVSKKKKAKRKTVVDQFSASKGFPKKPRQAPMPSPVAIELIRPGKRKIRVSVNAVESTPSKRMR